MIRRGLAIGVFLAAATVLAVALLLLRITLVTDFMYHAAVKDPERRPPAGHVIVAPADGTVLYVKRVRAGEIPEVVKRGVRVPLSDHLKTDAGRAFGDGWLVGIYMNADGVHVNRVPLAGVVRERIVWNGPHMDMSAAESRIILAQLVPGWVALKKLLRVPPYDIEDAADFVRKSARETLHIEDVRGANVWVVRIADYSVGKILTWVGEGQAVETGQKLGMITWGSQTDLFLEETAGTRVRVGVGDFVYGGETVVASY